MDGPTVLDKTGYKNFRATPPDTGKRISLLIFNRSGEATSTFDEYTGILAAITENGVRFAEWPDGNPTFFYTSVGLGDIMVSRRPSNKYEIEFDRGNT